LQALFPLVPLAGADARLQPVWVEDVAEAIVRCLREPRTIGQTIECAGPEVFTLAELVRLAGRWSGHERPIVPLPMALGRLQALAMEMLPGVPLMSRRGLASRRARWPPWRRATWRTPTAAPGSTRCAPRPEGDAPTRLAMSFGTSPVPLGLRYRSPRAALRYLRANGQTRGQAAR
jgi:hypothetical protein